MVDTHCHLDFPDFAGRIPDTLAQAAAAGVTAVITISTTTENALTIAGIARDHSNVWHTAGVHPLYADKGPHHWPNLRASAASGKCVAWGELGLDNHYPTPARDLQRAVLEDQLGFILAARTGADGGPPVDLPIVLHCREAFDDLLPILRATGLPGHRFVFHCFTGTPDDARAALDFGAFVSFTGVLTYRNADDVRAAARLVPLDRVLVETDAPYLSPDPVRGKRPCVPAFVRHTAQALADLHGLPLADLEVRLNANTKAFFGLPDRAFLPPAASVPSR
ncbi:MAG: TatD family hydrolase [bacterium]|jgi:TatD DNase family protein|nr:TatD family hydrolase [Phycisphaerales bacterium]MCE2653717.1 TatD family hydrolase [Planctomycetaceae bacterium]